MWTIISLHYINVSYILNIIIIFLLSGMSTVPTSLISTIKSDQPTGKSFSPLVVVVYTLKDI